MIVKMKHLDLVCMANEREQTLERLRKLGVVHLDLGSATGEGIAEADGKAADAERAVRLIEKARDGIADDEINVHEREVSVVLALDEDRATLQAEKERLEKLIREYEPYGDFDPVLAKRLLERGVGEVKDLLPAALPEMRLGRMKEKLARVENRIRIDTAKIAGCDPKFIMKAFPAFKDAMAFVRARRLLEDHGAIAVISGWLPATKIADLMRVVQGGSDLFERANAPGWGVLLRDPKAGEIPPTLVEPPKLFRPMKALFEGLGISPGYTEGDVSIPFFCYFSLFFAMLVGDGAYGAIFLIVTLIMRRKLPKAWFILLTVFSSATIGWGLLSNTWFGAAIPCCAEWPTVKWLADPSYHNMMLLCFTIGVSHLMLARIWNGVCRLNTLDCLPEFGWAGVLFFMYLVTNAVVGIFAGIPSGSYAVLGVSVVLIVSRTRGAALGMLPFNIMSSLGDIISYVRLFAVGLASVKVAENFNSMASGLVAGDDAWWLKTLLALGMVAILVIGHTLNLAMAGLSILVHAVRLNTLEFSNHKGVSWSGYAFKPFKSTTKQ